MLTSVAPGYMTQTLLRLGRTGIAPYGLVACGVALVGRHAWRDCRGAEHPVFWPDVAAVQRSGLNRLLRTTFQ